MGKEVSSKSLLIASGCSYTDLSYKAYLDNGVTTWPELVSKELQIPCVNVARHGGSNDYICNSVTDAIFDYSDRDIIVMVLWTDSNRWKPCEPSKRLWKEDWLLTYQLRCMWRLNEFCKQQQIPIYQGHSASLLACLDIQDKPDLLMNNRYYSPEYFGPQNPTSNALWLGAEGYAIPGDGHPNQKGQDIIAEYFLIRYEGGDFEVPLPRVHNGKYIEFVYD